MALWPSKPRVSHKTGTNSEPISLDGGVNKHGTIFNIAKNQAWDCRNTTSKVPGALSVKPADTTIITKLEGGTNSFSTSSFLGFNIFSSSDSVDIIHYFVKDPDSTALYLIRYVPVLDVIIAYLYPTTTSRNSAIIDLIIGGVDYTVIANTSKVYECHGGYTFVELTEAPKTPIYTYDDYRLFALKDNVLSWSDVNSVSNWTTGEAGNITISEMKGNGTAAITFNDIIVVWSGKSMHFLYGDDTGNYQLGNTFEHGCLSLRAVAKADNGIYFLDFDGLKFYSEGRVTNVSDNINYWLQNLYVIYSLSSSSYANAAIGVNGDYVYISVPYGEVYSNITFEYNTKTGVIHVWDEGYYQFGKLNQKFYGAKATGLVEIGTDLTHGTAWYHETPMNTAQFNRQTVSQIPLLVDLPTGSTLKLAYNLNANTPSWTDLHTFAPNTDTQEVFVDIPITMLNNASKYQLKLYGTGPCTVHEIGIDGRVKIR